MQSDRRLLERRIERMMGLISSIVDDELRAEVTKHLCVLTSGLIEATCRDVLKGYVTKKCHPKIIQVVGAYVGGFQNLKVGKIFELLSSFDSNGAVEWRSAISDEAAAAIDSIVSNRHQIAHGRPIGLSYDVFAQYFKHAFQAVGPAT